MIKEREEINQLKKDSYEAPVIEKVEFDTQSTTVLGNCSGWKSTSLIY